MKLANKNIIPRITSAVFGNTAQSTIMEKIAPERIIVSSLELKDNSQFFIKKPLKTLRGFFCKVFTPLLLLREFQMLVDER